MKAKISAMMDGELNDAAFAQSFDALSRDGEALEAWCTYQLISDAIRDTPVLSAGFTARVAERLAQEPTVVAPGRVAAMEPRKWFALSAAASLAAVLFVGWMAFGTQQGGALEGSMAQAPDAVANQNARAALAPAKVPVMVPPPVSANDYLLAHQGFSPRVSLQGMAPYVRTVSEPVPGARK